MLFKFLSCGWAYAGLITIQIPLDNDLMINALLLSIAQLTDPRVLKIMLRVIGISLVVFLGIGFGLYYALQYGFSYYGPGDSSSNTEILGSGAIAAFTSFIITALAAWLLFRAIAITVLNVFADEIVDAVEAKHYPDRAVSAKPVSIWAGIKLGLASAGRLLGYNLLALPIYIVLAITGVGTAIAFLLVNGLLLGRDLEQMVIARHVDVKELKTDLGQQWHLRKLTRLLLGVGATLMFVVPFANLLAPVLGAAMATHLIHKRAQNRETL